MPLSWGANGSLPALQNLTLGNNDLINGTLPQARPAQLEQGLLEQLSFLCCLFLFSLHEATWLPLLLGPFFLA